MANLSKSEFIKEVARCVQKYAPKYGILVHSPIIAQACLESGYGTSYKAVYHNNILGLKYRKGRVNSNNGYFEDGGSEQNPDGSYVQLPSSTAWYHFDSIEKCIEGYFQFINIPNYSALKGETDPYQYLVKIKAAGYATSLSYIDNVYKTLTTNNLTQYDITGGNKTMRVAIDAGHGSNTAGKRHPDGYREHYSNTYMAFYLDQILTQNGIETFKVSWDDENVKDDTDVALTVRQQQIKAWKADITVSIHANAFGDGNSYNNANGIETLYHSSNAKAGDSARLANCIQTELIKGTKQTNRKVKRAALAMCNCPAMGVKAAALVETAFMTNKAESDLLKSDEFCRECAREMAQGIFNYGDIKGNVNVPLKPATEAPVNPTPAPATPVPSPTIKAGDSFKFTNVNFYQSSTAKTVGSKKSGTFYVWSNSSLNGRIRMTNSKARVGVVGQVTGWVDEKVLLDMKGISTSTTNTSSGTVTKYMFENINYAPVFDPTFYANKYPDVVKVFGTNSSKLFEHFTKYGMKEGRQGCADFIVNVYMERYDDLKKAFGTNLPKYYKHYITNGIKEGRSAK